MKRAHPPRLALWLLQHQVDGYRVESLVGDLTEEYALGRSTGWLWSQVLRAVGGTYLRTLRSFGLRFLGAILVGWGILLVGIKLLELTWAIFEHRPGTFNTDFSAQHPASSAFDGTELLAVLVDFAVGRLVVRIYKPHPKLVAGAFALSILAMWDLPWLCTLPRDTAHLTAGLLLTFLWTAGVWLGGLWQTRRDARIVLR